MVVWKNDIVCTFFPADIHVAAKEIAEINNLDMNKICDKLLAKWLCPSTPPPGVRQHFGVWRKVTNYIKYGPFFPSICSKNPEVILYKLPVVLMNLLKILIPS